MTAPDYHHESQLEAYRTDTVSGPDGTAHYLTQVLDKILYPDNDARAGVARLFWDNEFYQARFSYTFVPYDAASAPWLKEYKRVKVVHSQSVKGLGAIALPSIVKEAYEISVENVFVKRSVPNEILVNEYSIFRIGHNDPTLAAVVTRLKLGDESSGAYPMTEFDAGQLYDSLFDLNSAIIKNSSVGSASE